MVGIAGVCAVGMALSGNNEPLQRFFCVCGGLMVVGAVTHSLDVRYCARCANLDEKYCCRKILQPNPCMHTIYGKKNE